MISDRVLYKISIIGFIFLLVLIAILSLLPDPLSDLPDKPGIDKVYHFLAYLCLGFSFYLVLILRREVKGGNRYSMIIPVLIFALVYGGSIELLQGFTGRSPELLDLLSDAAGGVTGAFLGTAALKLLHTEPGIDKPESERK